MIAVGSISVPNVGIELVYPVSVVLLIVTASFIRKESTIDVCFLNLSISVLIIGASFLISYFSVKNVLAIVVGLIGIWVGIDAIAALQSGRSIGNSNHSETGVEPATERVSDMAQIGNSLKKNPMTASEIATETGLSLAEVQQGLQTLSTAQTISYHSLSSDDDVVWEVEELNVGLDSFVGSVVGGAASRLILPFNELLTGKASF